MRTKFTSEQINRLEDTFGRHKYLGATQRRKIAEKLSLSETQVNNSMAVNQWAGSIGRVLDFDLAFNRDL